MKPVFLSAITHLHGAPRALAELGEAMPIDLTLPEHGLAQYRVSDLETWELAQTAAERTRALADADADFLLYATENDADAARSLARIARRLGTPGVDGLAISGHACADLGPALELASYALTTGRRRVLLVMADRAGENSRVTATGLSIFSDGGAACMLTGEPVSAGGASFAIRTVTTHVGADPPTDPARSILYTAALGEVGIAEVLKRSGQLRDDFRYVLFANFRISSQRFLTSALGFPQDRLLIGPVGEYAHSFSADILTNLDHFVAAGRFAHGDRFLVSAIGPYTWSIADVEYL